MATTYSARDAAAPRPESRYSGAAALVAAIRAAALVAPEVRPEAANPAHYAPQPMGGESVPVPAMLYGVYCEPGTDACEWPRRDRYEWRDAPEMCGPFLPAPDTRVTFHYACQGTRGAVSCVNRRADLERMAERVHKARALYDGKVKRAPRPSGRVASSSAPTLLRELVRAKEHAAALAVADGMGAVFFGSGPSDPVLYVMAERATVGAHALAMGLCAASGAWRVLHAESALAVDRHGRTGRDGFESAELAREWIAARATDAEFIGKIGAAAGKVKAYDQGAARDAFERSGIDYAPDAPEATEPAQDAAPAHASAPDGAQASAPAAIDPAPVLAAAGAANDPTEAPEPEPGAPAGRMPWQTPAQARVYAVHVRTFATAQRAGIVPDAQAWDATPDTADHPGRFLRARRAPEFGAPEVRALRRAIAQRMRAERAPLPGVSVRYVDAAQWDATVTRAQARAALADARFDAARTLQRIAATWAPDSARDAAIAGTLAGVPGAAARMQTHLERAADRSRGIERTEARAAIDALERALDAVVAAPPATHSRPPATQSGAPRAASPATHSEPATPTAQPATPEIDRARSLSAPHADALPELVQRALARIDCGEDATGACAWVWTRADYAHRSRVDAWIVRNGHSLGHHVGTGEARFRLLVDMEHDARRVALSNMPADARIVSVIRSRQCAVTARGIAAFTGSPTDARTLERITQECAALARAGRLVQFDHSARGLPPAWDVCRTPAYVIPPATQSVAHA